MSYVQYGCGLCAPEGWINFDASPTLRMQRAWVIGPLMGGAKFPRSVRYGNIIKGLPLADGSADVVYCSHVLEHLSLEDFRRALRNTFRVLKAGGTFRFVMPDLRFYARQYLADTAPDAAVKFLKVSILGQEKRPSGFGGFIREWMGNSQHRWMWDYESAEPELTAAGFTNLRRAAQGDNPDPMFTRVEETGRWQNCLGAECVKPGPANAGRTEEKVKQTLSAGATA